VTESQPPEELTPKRIQREAIDRDRANPNFAYGPPSIQMWPGQCLAVVLSVLRNGLADGRQSNGTWCGPVAQRHRDRYDPAEVALRRVRHTWITLTDGRVLDPTRWVFDDSAPYVYVGTDPERWYLPQ